MVETLTREEVATGPVQLLVSLDETGPQLYEAEIQEIINRDKTTKNLVVQVTDPRLLERTGGIVQGMSGAPILQNGKLAGAVTHVFTRTPPWGTAFSSPTCWRGCPDMPGGPGDAPARFLACGEKAHPPPCRRAGMAFFKLGQQHLVSQGVYCGKDGKHVVWRRVSNHEKPRL